MEANLQADVARTCTPSATTALACLLALVAAIYAVALPGPFQFDDRATVAVDPGAQSLVAWWTDAGRHVRPLLKASFAATSALGDALGNAAAGHRLANVLIHLAAVLVAFALGRRIATTCLSGVDERTANRAALLAAAIFALHPLATEAVSYVSGRSMSLGTLLAMASLYAHIRARTDSRRWLWCTIAIAACGAAMLVRETAFVTPALWLLWEWAREDLRTPAFSALRIRSLVGKAAMPAAIVGVFALWLLVHDRYAALLDLSRQIASGRLGEPSLLAALAYFASGFALLRYPNIDPQVAPGLLSPEARVAGTAIVAAIVVLAWRRRKARPELLFALLWSAAWLVPLYAFPVRHDAVAERHVYSVLWGVAFALGLAWARWMRDPGPFRVAARASAALALAALVTVTLVRNADYRSEVALWEAASRGAPEKLRVLNNLGVVYMEAGRWDDARRVLERAAALDPYDERVRENLLSARERRIEPLGWVRLPE